MNENIVNEIGLTMPIIGLVALTFGLQNLYLTLLMMIGMMTIYCIGRIFSDMSKSKTLMEFGGIGGLIFFTVLLGQITTFTIFPALVFVVAGAIVCFIPEARGLLSRRLKK